MPASNQNIAAPRQLHQNRGGRTDPGVLFFSLSFGVVFRGWILLDWFLVIIFG